MEELVSARIFSSLASGIDNSCIFYGHLCCMIFFTVKALQEFFFSNLPSPTPLQRSNGPPLNRFY